MVLHFHATGNTLNTKDEVLQKARALETLGGFECERELMEARETFIKTKILQHELLVFKWAVGHVASDGSAKRVNGQHSSHVSMDLTDEEWQRVRLPIWITEEHYQCDTPEDRAYLFNQFDPRQSSRNHEDNIGVHMAMHEDLQGCDRYSANKATQGIQWYLRQTEEYQGSEARSQFQIVHRKDDIHRFLLFCDSLLDKRKTAELVSRPVVAAMFHTTRHGHVEAYSFWKNVAVASIMDPDSYEAQLADFLEKVRKPHYDWPRGAREKFANKRKPIDKEVFQACLRVYHARQLHTPLRDVIDRLRDRTVAQIIERYAIPDVR